MDIPVIDSSFLDAMIWEEPPKAQSCPSSPVVVKRDVQVSSLSPDSSERIARNRIAALARRKLRSGRSNKSLEYLVINSNLDRELRNRNIAELAQKMYKGLFI